MAHHVTTFRLKAQAGKGDAVLAMFDKWDRERKPKVTGFQRSVVVKSNNDAEEFTVIVEFDSFDNYHAMSDQPEQGAWFEELSALLAGDPEWFDGTVARDAGP